MWDAATLKDGEELLGGIPKPSPRILDEILRRGCASVPMERETAGSSTNQRRRCPTCPPSPVCMLHVPSGDFNDLSPRLCPFDHRGEHIFLQLVPSWCTHEPWALVVDRSGVGSRCTSGAIQSDTVSTRSMLQGLLRTNTQIAQWPCWAGPNASKMCQYPPCSTNAVHCTIGERRSLGQWRRSFEFIVCVGGHPSWGVHPASRCHAP